MSSRVAITPPGLTSVPAVTVLRPSTPEKGARMVRSPCRAWAAFSAAWAVSSWVSYCSTIIGEAKPRSPSWR